MVFIYEHINESEQYLISLFQEITTINTEGQYIVNLTFNELKELKNGELDILQKYKYCLRQFEEWQRMQQKMKDELNKAKK